MVLNLCYLYFVFTNFYVGLVTANATAEQVSIGFFMPRSGKTLKSVFRKLGSVWVFIQACLSLRGIQVYVILLPGKDFFVNNFVPRLADVSTFLRSRHYNEFSTAYINFR